MQTIITLEITDHCNLKCTMCDQFKKEMPHNLPKGFMTLETWKAFIDSLEKFHGNKFLTPFWLGESLVNPHFSEMIKYAFEKNDNNKLFDSISLNTNAVLMNEEKTETILYCSSLKNQGEKSFSRLHISLDANSEETFKKIKNAEGFQKVIDNLDFFLKMRKEMGLKYPLLTIAFIISEDNKHETKDFLDYWKNKLEGMGLPVEVCYDWPKSDNDSIYLRRLDCDNQGEAESLHKKVLTDIGLIEPPKKEERIIQTNSVLTTKEVRKPCPGLWKTPIIYRNGDVTTCCFDIEIKNKIGNLNEENLYDLWHSPKMTQWRLSHILGEFDKAGPLCANCANLNSPTISVEEITEYLKSINREDLIDAYLKRISE